MGVYVLLGFQLVKLPGSTDRAPRAFSPCAIREKAPDLPGLSEETHGLICGANQEQRNQEPRNWATIVLLRDVIHVFQGRKQKGGNGRVPRLRGEEEPRGNSRDYSVQPSMLQPLCFGLNCLGLELAKYSHKPSVRVGIPELDPAFGPFPGSHRKSVCSVGSRCFGVIAHGHGSCQSSWVPLRRTWSAIVATAAIKRCSTYEIVKPLKCAMNEYTENMCNRPGLIQYG